MPRRRLAFQLELIAQTQEWQHLAAQVQIFPVAMGGQLDALHHGVQRHNEIILADCGQEAVNNGQRQWQANDKARALARFALDFHRAAQRLNIARHHVQTHAAPGQIAHPVGGGEARSENQRSDFFVGQALVGGHQALGHGLGQNLVVGQAAAVIADLNHHAAGIMIGVQLNAPARRLAGSLAFFL